MSFQNYADFDSLLKIIPKQNFNPGEFDIDKEARIRESIIAGIKAERELKEVI